jgi:hypothetical protein
MRNLRPSIAVLRTLLLLSLGLGSTGCKDVLGPVPLRTTRVRGVVREGKRPVSGGWIEFLPVDGTVGNLRSAPLRGDGSFEADQVAVGENGIRLVHALIESPVASRLFGSNYWLIRRVIPLQPGEPMVVDLVEEAIRFQHAKSPDAGSGSTGLEGTR